jgi:hypothetical protein
MERMVVVDQLLLVIAGLFHPCDVAGQPVERDGIDPPGG